MNEELFRDHYEKRGLSQEEADAGVAAIRAYERAAASPTIPSNPWTMESMSAHLGRLIDADANSPSALLALARYAYLAGHSDIYVYFTSILGIDGIVTIISDQVAEVAGEEKRQEIFGDLAVPPVGSPPDAVPPLTEQIVKRMQKSLSEADCRDALTGNVHEIPRSAFAAEREKFLAAESLDAYLADYHARQVATLQEHCDQGKVWFEQRISQPVVDFVRGDREVLGGVREGNTIHVTKIPYKPGEWLAETNETRRRYLACHCPMARAALKPGAAASAVPDIPPVWCRCSAGFTKIRFDVIFDEPVEVEVVETVLDGDDRCRFAITIPERFA